MCVPCVLGCSNSLCPAGRGRGPCAHFVLLCSLELSQVLERRVEPLAVFPQALLAVLDIPVDLNHLCLEHMPVRLEAAQHVDQI